MKIPISNALFNGKFNYEKYFKNNKKNISDLSGKNLEFFPVDKNKFTTLGLIPEMNTNESSSIIINAANEIFVDQFLKNNIRFNDISAYLNLVLKNKNYIKTSKMSSNSIKNIYKIDFLAREIAYKIIKQKKNNNSNV